jgi:hypothetical protein
MRFRLTHPKAIQSRSKKASLINRITSSMHLHASAAQEDSPFVLKFLEKLSDEHLLIGNEYQLNLLDLSGIQEDFVGTSSGWSIAEDEPITQIFVMSKSISLLIQSAVSLLFVQELCCSTVFGRKQWKIRPNCNSASPSGRK